MPATWPWKQASAPAAGCCRCEADRALFRLATSCSKLKMVFSSSCTLLAPPRPSACRHALDQGQAPVTQHEFSDARLCAPVLPDPIGYPWVSPTAVSCAHSFTTTQPMWVLSQKASKLALLVVVVVVLLCHLPPARYTSFACQSFEHLGVLVMGLLGLGIEKTQTEGWGKLQPRV